ncbi:outer membrane protein assembly factor BamB family protein [Herbidospora sp. RD11066]
MNWNAIGKLCVLLLPFVAAAASAAPAPTTARESRSHPVLVSLWSKKSTSRPASIQRAGNVLLLGGGKKIEALDVRTGETLWERDDVLSADDIGSIDSLAASGSIGVAAFSFERESGGADITMLDVFDIRTGDNLWKSGSGFEGRPDHFDVPGIAHGAVYLRMSERGEIVSLDQQTSRTRWRSPAPPGCGVDVVRVHTRKIFALGSCQVGRGAVWAVSPVTGRIVWRHDLTATFDDLAVRGDVLQVSSKEALVVLDLDGGPVHRQQLIDEVIEFYDAHTMALEVDGGSIDLIDRRTGQVTDSLPSAKFDSPDSGPYFFGPVTEEDWGSLLYWVDGAGRARPMAWFAPPEEPDSIADDLVVSAGAETLTVYEIRDATSQAQEAAARGGVPSERWPDACSLLPDEVGGVRYERSPYPGNPALGLPVATRCHADPVEGDGPTIQIEVIRELASEPDARLLFSTVHPYDEELTPDLADQAIAAHDPDLITFRSGSTLLRVLAEGDPELARQLVRHAHRTLTGER